jgi:hypothetical protein
MTHLSQKSSFRSGGWSSGVSAFIDLTFLETRTSGSKEIWQLLQNACQEDNETAQALIGAADLTMPQNSLTTCIDTAGVYYRVPIACINEPNNYD